VTALQRQEEARSRRSAEAMTDPSLSRQTSTRRAAVLSVSPDSAISFLTDPISPTTTGPQCRLVRTCAGVPNSRS
jgi:hypothetical protein